MDQVSLTQSFVNIRSMTEKLFFQPGPEELFPVSYFIFRTSIYFVHNFHAAVIC